MNTKNYLIALSASSTSFLLASLIMLDNGNINMAAFLVCVAFVESMLMAILSFFIPNSD